MSQFFKSLGIVLILVAVFLRLTGFPVIVSQTPVQSISLVILANTCLLLAILLKK
jgi:hypothetical protein